MLLQSIIYVEKELPQDVKEFYCVKVGWMLSENSRQNICIIQGRSHRTNRIASDINNVPTKSAKDKGYYVFWVFNDEVDQTQK